MQEKIHRGGLTSVILSVLLLGVIIVSACETAFYIDFGWYEKEYEKYDCDDHTGVAIDGLMEVTRYMMSYLRGDKEVLSVEAEVKGETIDFFNDEERDHMVDVQFLFLKGLQLRRICLFGIALVILLAVLFKRKFWLSFPGIFIKVTAAFFILLGILAYAVSLNFNRAFMIFHEIFFSFREDANWMFDVNTSRMINMLPERFFLDMAVRVAVFCVGFVLFAVAAAIVLRIFMGIKDRRKKKLIDYYEIDEV